MAVRKINDLDSAPNDIADDDIFIIGQDDDGNSYTVTGAQIKAYVLGLSAAPAASDFTLVQSTSAVATLTDQTTSPVTNGVKLEVTTGGTGDRIGLAERNTPGATWTMIAKLTPQLVFGMYRSFGLYAKDNTGKIHSFCFGNTTSGDDYNGNIFVALRWSAIGTFVSSVQQNESTIYITKDMWYKLELDATNLIFSISYDKVNWIKIYTVAKGAYLGATIDKCGVFFCLNPFGDPNTPTTENVIIQEFSLAA